MNEARIARIAFAVTFWLAAVLPLCDTAVAQKANVSGVIVGSSGATVTVKSQDAGMVAVLLSDNTDIRETEGSIPTAKEAARSEGLGARLTRSNERLLQRSKPTGGRECQVQKRRS